MAATTEVVRKKIDSTEIKPFHNFFRLRKGEQIVYVLGTNHSVSIDQLPTWAKSFILEAFAQSKFCVFEGKFQAYTRDMFEQEGCFLNANQRKSPWFSRLLTPYQQQIRNMVEAVAARHGITLQAEELLIPAVAKLLIQNLFEGGMDSNLQCDYCGDKEVLYLNEPEDTDQLIRITDCDQLPVDLDELLPLLESHFGSEADELREKIFADYLSGELPAFEAEELDELRAINKRWVSKMMSRLNPEISFIAIGNAHLYQPPQQNVLNQFRDLGFEIERLTLAGEYAPYTKNQTFLPAQQGKGAKEARPGAAASSPPTIKHK